MIHGDCLKVLPTLEEQSVDLVVTDPPYGFNRFKTDDDSCVRVTKWAFVEIKRILKRGGFAFIFAPVNQTLIKMINAIPLRFHRLMWMYKPNDMTYPWGRWLQTSEAIAIFSNAKPNFDFLDKSVYAHNCYIHKNVGQEGVEGHPTVKPLKVIEDLVRGCLKDGVVLDPFLGSGTTMMACQNLRRSCIGIEINPEYSDIAKKRCFERRFLDREVKYIYEKH